MSSGVADFAYSDHDDYVSDRIFPSYKKRAIKITAQLGYGLATIKKLEQSLRVAQVSQILNTARNTIL